MVEHFGSAADEASVALLVADAQRRKAEILRSEQQALDLPGLQLPPDASAGDPGVSAARMAGTAAQVRRIMITTMGDAPNESTPLRHFRTLDIPAGTAAAATGRFEADHPSEIWVGDALHGPKIGVTSVNIKCLRPTRGIRKGRAAWANQTDTTRQNEDRPWTYRSRRNRS